MYRSQYDSDVTVFSPQGRLFQVEYAQEAVKQGAPCVAVVSKKHAVLAGLKRSSGDLSASATKKLISIAPHVGCGIAGLTSDARVLTKSMQRDAQAQLISLDRAVPVSHLINTIATDKAQQSTQYYGGRPFGVGLLVIGVDDTGPHLYEFSPAGTCLEYSAWAIGSRAQSARTVLEGRYDALPEGSLDNPFAELSLDELIQQALTALSHCLPPDQSLSEGNCSVGLVGIETDFRIISDTEVARYLVNLPARPSRGIPADRDETMEAA